LSIPSAEPIPSTGLPEQGHPSGCRGVMEASKPLLCTAAGLYVYGHWWRQDNLHSSCYKLFSQMENGEGEALPLPPRLYVAGLRYSCATRLLQTFEEARISRTIYLEQAKGALFGAEERVVNRHERTGHFAFEFSDGRFTRPHQGALDRFKRRF
jgi:hypothetical protein